MEIIEKKLEDIRPYEKNPRKNDGAVEYVANSIKEFGFKVPIVIDENGVIVAGHTRYKASQKLGLDVVPCVVADDLTEKQIQAFRLADNKVSEQARWDNELLGEELADLADTFQMQDFGFDFGANVVPTEEREDLSDKVDETYEVIVECNGEIEQQEAFEKLQEMGYVCRVLTL